MVYVILRRHGRGEFTHSQGLRGGTASVGPGRGWDGILHGRAGPSKAEVRRKGGPRDMAKTFDATLKGMLVESQAGSSCSPQAALAQTEGANGVPSCPRCGTAARSISGTRVGRPSSKER